MSYQVTYHVKEPVDPGEDPRGWLPILEVTVRDAPVVPVRGHRAIWQDVLYEVDDVVHLLGKDRAWVFLEAVKGERPPCP